MTLTAIFRMNDKFGMMLPGIFRMSGLQWKMGIMFALVAALVIFEALTRLYDKYRIDKGIEEDRSKNNTFLTKYHKVPHSVPRILAEGFLFIGAGVMMIMVYAAHMDYERHGAYYDGSWREPGVESHFYFTNDDTEFLSGLYRSNPDGFVPGNYKVCLVKLGCKDCEDLKDVINALPDDVYVVFCTSDVGRLYVEEYGVNYVPCVIAGDLWSPLSSVPGESDIIK